MPWTPTYTAQFTEQLVDQLLAIVQRDQRAALDFVAGAGVLPDIVNYLTAPSPMSQYPALLIAPTDNAFDDSAVGSLHYSSQIEAEIGVTHQDARMVSRLLQRYLRALDAVFRSVLLSDFSTALPLELPELGGATMTAPLQAGSVKELWVGAHRMSEIAALKSGFWKAAKLEIRIDREEL